MSDNFNSFYATVNVVSILHPNPNQDDHEKDNILQIIQDCRCPQASIVMRVRFRDGNGTALAVAFPVECDDYERLTHTLERPSFHRDPYYLYGTWDVHQRHGLVLFLVRCQSFITPAPNAVIRERSQFSIEMTVDEELNSAKIARLTEMSPHQTCCTRPSPFTHRLYRGFGSRDGRSVFRVDLVAPVSASELRRGNRYPVSGTVMIVIKTVGKHLLVLQQKGLREPNQRIAGAIADRVEEEQETTK